MDAFVRLTSRVAPLLRDNVDTDAIIPASYMRSLATDPASGLFARWRLRADGSPDPAFVLNDQRYRGARILLAGANFGCGSSRENAVWALAGGGYRCVIARSFSDIFTQNAFQNGVLPLALDAANHARLAAAATSATPVQATIDVAARQVEWTGAEPVAFPLDDRQQDRLLRGLDPIAETLREESRIERFRAAQRARAPWLGAPSESDESRS